MPAVTIDIKPIIIGVIGSNRDDSPAMAEARLIGEEIAKRGYVLLTGGGTGIMKAASEGAYRAGGLVVGILPGERGKGAPGYPNEFVHIPIYTGMSDGRNSITAKTPDVIIALPGGLGTISELAIALKSGIPVIGIEAPCLQSPGDATFHRANSVEEAMKILNRLLSSRNNIRT